MRLRYGPGNGLPGEFLSQARSRELCERALQIIEHVQIDARPLTLIDGLESVDDFTLGSRA